MSREPVHAIHEYFDQPKLGVAHYRGRPHVYEREFSEAQDDYTDRYYLTEIDPDLLALVKEDWEIFLRWAESFKRGETTIETHPALPHERHRHDELRNLIGDRVRTDHARCAIARAEFRAAGGGTEVKWHDVGANNALDRTTLRRCYAALRSSDVAGQRGR